MSALTNVADRAISVEADLEYRRNSASKKYGVPKSTVSTWLANKDKILTAYESGEINPKRQKMKRAEDKDLDKAVYTWFHNTRANNVPVLVLF